jgi:hypothetical protein
MMSDRLLQRLEALEYHVNETGTADSQDRQTIRETLAEIIRLCAALTAAETVKPREADRIQHDDDGSLDEIFVEGGAHLERMGDTDWFLRLIRSDGESYAVWFQGKIIRFEEQQATRP